MEKDAYLKLLKSKKQEILNLIKWISEVEFSQKSIEKLNNYKTLALDLHKDLLKGQPVAFSGSLRDKITVIVSYLKYQIANKCDSLIQFIAQGNQVSFMRLIHQLKKHEKELSSMYEQIA